MCCAISFALSQKDINPKARSLKQPLAMTSRTIDRSLLAVLTHDIDNKGGEFFLCNRFADIGANQYLLQISYTFVRFYDFEFKFG